MIGALESLGRRTRSDHRPQPPNHRRFGVARATWTLRWVAPADDGSASLWALAMAMVLWVSVAGVVLAGVAISARHRAATAADLSALAAASALQRAQLERDPTPGATACAAARSIAAANEATVDSCQVAGSVVEVTTSVAIPASLSFLGLDSISARARAGPA
jgi:secretion/DNA translocation related TadE-like protein